ncbi:MAG: hypothetical protein GY827_11485 [Cytophagales bacterium]|nr:hypothetical protein [Cytophagales bacterium]
MRKLLFIMIASVLSISFAMAQGGKRKNLTPEQRVEKQMNRLTKKLQLTDDQKPKVEAIVKTKVEAMTALRAQKSTLKKKEFKMKRKEILVAFDTEIKKELNTQQLTKYNKWKKKKRAKRKQRRKNRKAKNATTETDVVDILED